MKSQLAMSVAISSLALIVSVKLANCQIEYCPTNNCPSPQDCVVEDGQERCACLISCAEVEEPVCGTDGETYGNNCKLEAENCRTGRDILVAYQGKCNCNNQSEYPSPNCDQQQQDACAGVECPARQECEVEDGQARCVCGSVCPQNEDFVCGSDGNTYGNPCKLAVANCKSNGQVTQAYTGRC